MAGIGGRWSTNADLGYYVYTDGLVWELASDNPTFTSLGTFSQSLVSGTTYAVKLEIRDATKRVYIDGIQRISSADDTITQVGQGLIFARSTTNTTGIHVDNYQINDLATGGVTPTRPVWVGRRVSYTPVRIY